MNIFHKYLNEFLLASIIIFSCTFNLHTMNKSASETILTRICDCSRITSFFPCSKIKKSEITSLIWNNTIFYKPCQCSHVLAKIIFSYHSQNGELTESFHILNFKREIDIEKTKLPPQDLQLLEYSFDDFQSKEPYEGFLTQEMSFYTPWILRKQHTSIGMTTEHFYGVPWDNIIPQRLLRDIDLKIEDFLTKLSNKQFIVSLFSQKIIDARDKQQLNPLALLDDFKKFFDTVYEQEESEDIIKKIRLRININF